MEKNQTLLHQKIKNYYADMVNGEKEVTITVSGKKYRIDVLDTKNDLFYEIQLDNFGKHFYEKVNAMQKVNKVIIVHPITVIEKLILLDSEKSDNKMHIKQKTVKKRNDFYSFFEKLVSFKIQFEKKRLEFHLLLIEEKVVKKFAYIRSGRPRYHTKQRDLLNIKEKLIIRTTNDFIKFIPKDLKQPFTNSELASSLKIKGGITRRKKIAGCLTYSLCSLNILNRVGKKGNAFLFDFNY